MVGSTEKESANLIAVKGNPLKGNQILHRRRVNEEKVKCFFVVFPGGSVRFACVITAV